ncbi:MAG: hypothetical protein HRT64_13930 [Erythrobacter sp.]|nr:hypothetical protein [Erythrobacter sp.]
MSAWRSQVSATKQNALAATNIVSIESLINEIRELEVASDTDVQNSDYDPLPDILSTLQGIGEQAQLKNPIGLPRNQNERPEGEAILKTYPYQNINDPSLEKLLDWVKLAEEQIPGLHVRELSIEPRQQFWSMDIVLARYERKP